MPLSGSQKFFARRTRFRDRVTVVEALSNRFAKDLLE